MAAIASNPVFSSAPASSSQPVDDARASGKPSDFMQLVSQMTQGKTPGEPLPADLMALLLTGDTAGLSGLEGTEPGETDPTDSESDASDEAGAMALSALLAGMQAYQAVPVAGSPEGDSQGVGSVGPSGSQKLMQALLATTEGALADTLSGATDDAADAAGADGGNGSGSAASLNGAPNASQPTSASHLQAMMLAHQAADAAPAAASAEVRTPVGAQGWGDELGTHLAMMAANGHETASLRLSPEHLGPLEIQISVKDGQANVVFGASNADTRSALEQSLPRLREMFASQGLVLGDANVSRDAPRDSFKPSSFANASRGSSDASPDGSVKPITMTRLGLVDTYV
ncbi:MAG: flagellar hook-length control protein FliK [Gammaproteobacteria bacterium]